MKQLISLLIVITGIYILICICLFSFQEKLIFFPHKLDKSHTFEFESKFEELNFKTNDGQILNGLLFKANESKGLIFYLHGNAGALNTWGNVANTYTALNYDVFILDYRSFGKSEGSIISQDQLFSDNQLVYDALKTKYKEENIIILGYSIGSGLAAKLASTNQPSQLILQAPYFSLTDLMSQNYSWIPTFILKYKFDTNTYLEHCNIPITIFHGTQDQVIDYSASLKLKQSHNKINLITLENQTHNNLTNHQDYQNALKILLQ